MLTTPLECMTYSSNKVDSSDSGSLAFSTGVRNISKDRSWPTFSKENSLSPLMMAVLSGCGRDESLVANSLANLAWSVLERLYLGTLRWKK